MYGELENSGKKDSLGRNKENHEELYKSHVLLLGVLIYLISLQ
jgi:hypothetical protein